MLNVIEMTSQVAAWYLIERQRIKKTLKEISELDEDSTDIWKEDWFDKYLKWPEEMEAVSLAKFVSKYTRNQSRKYVERQQPRGSCYRNYDMAKDFKEYKREMVTLDMPFRDEEIEILSEMRLITVYAENEQIILERRKEFESNLDLRKAIEICRQPCRENEVFDDDDESEIRNVAVRFPEPNPFQELYI